MARPAAGRRRLRRLGRGDAGTVATDCSASSSAVARAGAGIRRLRRLGRADAGAVAGWEALPFGLLVFVVGTLVVANAWGAVDAKMAAAGAAREGARAFVEASDAVAATTAAQVAALDAVEGHGRERDSASVSADGAFERCAQVTVSVEVAVPTIPVPWVGGLGPDLTVRSTHAELVDPLRSGVPGEASCVRP